MTGTHRFPVLLGVVLLAATAEPIAGESDPDLLAEMCAACHGPDGRSPGSVPSLETLNEAAMRALLFAFRDGAVEATVMDRVARALTDEEIRSLARHFEKRAE